MIQALLFVLFGGETPQFNSYGVDDADNPVNRYIAFAC